MNAYMTKPASLLLAGLLALMPMLAGADTLERVRASNTFTLGYLPDFAPFSSQEGDKASGYAIDLCLKIADRLKTGLGLPALQVRYQPVKLADEISAVSSGRVDILCTPTPATLERRKTVSFSVPIYTAGLSAVVRKDAPEALLKVLNGEAAHTGPTWRATVNRGLADYTYAAVEGGVSEDWIREQMRLLGVVTSLVTVADTDEGVKLVADGKANAFFSERMLLKNDLLKDDATRDLMVVDRIFEYAPVSMVLERGDEDFRLLVDTVLSEMYRSGEIEQAYAKYLGGASDTARQLFKIYALP
ncbi:amino acid ABC transporter substrate-binding protein [Pseudomonas sp. LS1212]|uniref:amino acid ABC transporter substrate-binding protein n=1 Tax=Pseudomonas sp. LS1212 TaxID=2972478 RepID=UPI00215CCBB9|nr:amino acid ABC transporter substrate-binding protein [Pseudomonas sp. LS1212]UVJ41768.1 amino acid ABC transporter substrate-binding protein [Pseudomonas sp. LS1212]